MSSTSRLTKSLFLLLGLVLFLVLPPFALGQKSRIASPKSRPKDDPAAGPAMRLLQANCFSCHNEEKKKGGLILTDRNLLLKGGDDGPVAVASKPSESLLLRVLQPDSDPHMPPKKQLSTNQIALLQRWISAGLPWDTNALANADATHPVILGALPASYKPVLALAYSTNTHRLAVGKQGRIIIYDAGQTNFPIVHDITAHSDVIRSLNWSPDGRWLASGAFREISLWDGASMKRLNTITNTLLGRVTVLRFLPDGRKLVAADGRPAMSGWIKLIETESGKVENSWKAHEDTIFDLALNRDGTLLATAGGDKLVKLWNLDDHKEIARLEGHAGAVTGVAFDGDGSRLISAGADKQVKVWDAKTRENIVILGSHKHSLTCAFWTSNDQSIFVGDETGSLFRYTEIKRHTGEQSSASAQEKLLGQSKDAVNLVDANSDGSRIFAGAQDGAVYVWDNQGKLVARLE